MFKIESGIELVKRSRKNGGRKPIYPFQDMKCGDSFLVEDKKLIHRVGNAAAAFSRGHEGYKFAIRQVDGGFRCWRIPVE